MPKPKTSNTKTHLHTIRRSLSAIERALARLAPVLRAAERSGRTAGRAGGRRLVLSPKRQRELRLQGSYLGYMRQLAPRQKARVRSVRTAKGIRTAITLARTLAEKRRR